MKKKPIKITKSLLLDKETIQKLDEDQLNEIAGGGNTDTCNGTPPPAQALEANLELPSCHACSCN
jgi:hypothetical protein